MLLAAIGEREIGLPIQLSLHHVADADAAGRGQRFEACRHIDPVPEQILSFNNNITKVDADTKGDLTIRWDFGLIDCDALLEGYGTGDGVDGGGEFHNGAVPHQLDDAALVFCQQRIEELLSDALDRCERDGFIGFHQARIASYIGCKNCREAPLDPGASHRRSSRLRSVGTIAIFAASTTAYNLIAI